MLELLCDLTKYDFKISCSMYISYYDYLIGITNEDLIFVLELKKFETL